MELKHLPEDIDASWVADMLKRAGGKPLAIMLEQSRGPLVHALMFREIVLLFPINPKPFARYRESYPGGGKDDPTDAKYLARMLRERIATLVGRVAMGRRANGEQERFWRDVIARQGRSGLSITAFCRQEEITAAC